MCHGKQAVPPTGYQNSNVEIMVVIVIQCTYHKLNTLILLGLEFCVFFFFNLRIRGSYGETQITLI